MMHSSSIDVMEPSASSSASPFVSGGGILKRKGSSPSSQSLMHRRFSNNKEAGGDLETSAVSSPPMVRKRSILKHESSVDEGAPSSTSSQRLKGVLKKDSSYDEGSSSGIRPILKNAEDLVVEITETTTIPKGDVVSTAKGTGEASSSSNEDIAKSNQFEDVVIDPIPGASRVADDSPPSELNKSKPALRDREPLIPPSSVQISSDDRDLALKLEQIANEADNLKKRKMQAEKEKEKEEALSVEEPSGKNDADQAMPPR